MFSTSEIDNRISQCEKILDQDPNSQIFAALADSYRKKGEFDKAFRVCQNGLRIHTSYGAAHVVMSKINLDRGIYDFAEIEANKAIEIDGRTCRNELLLAEIYIYQGAFEKAIMLLKRLSKENPENEQIVKLLKIAERIPNNQSLDDSQQEFEQPVEKEEVKKENIVEDKIEKVVIPEVSKPSSSNVVSKGTEITGVEAVISINNEGLVLDAQGDLKNDKDLYGATLGEVSNFLIQDLVETSFGQFQTILIEATEEIYYLKKANEGIYIFVANNDTNLGSLRMKVDSLLA
jgi:tetratricopeptide (TPR) repeat protein